MPFKFWSRDRDNETVPVNTHTNTHPWRPGVVASTTMVVNRLISSAMRIDDDNDWTVHHKAIADNARDEKNAQANCGAYIAVLLWFHPVSPRPVSGFHLKAHISTVSLTLCRKYLNKRDNRYASCMHYLLVHTIWFRQSVARPLLVTLLVVVQRSSWDENTGKTRRQIERCHCSNVANCGRLESTMHPTTTGANCQL